ncbi:MAG: VOC family protein [Myxococcales bacterium]|jgi:catechol 2,3-dioxygenase-like lactoylglutathione lyase family enzyme
MLESATLMAFAATTQPAKARAFYEGSLGLRVVSDDDFALALDAHGTHLRIQKVGELTPAPFTALGFQVADIAATVDGLRARGVSFQIFPGMGQDERGIWRAPSGAQVAWFRDPDGNTLSLTQF